MTVSAALIVKNEARTLARCLESIRDSVDEIVVVDTGSEDGSRDVAHRFTDRVYDFQWRRDFAAARQFSFRRATGDWVFWVDADDVVLHADRIRPTVAAAGPDVTGFAWKYVYARDRHGHSTAEMWRERCVRNDGSFRWVGRVHEALRAVLPGVIERNADVVVVHHRDPDRQGDRRRNLEILLAEYRRRRRPEPRLLLYLGREYADVGEPESALHFLQRYVDAAPDGEETYLAHVRVAGLCRLRRRWQDALDADLAALELLPHWPHAYFSLAETYYFLRQWLKVVHWVEAGRRLPAPATACVVDPMDLTYRWIILYTNALYHVGRVEEALEWTGHALALCPDDAWHRANERLFSTMLTDANLDGAHA